MPLDTAGDAIKITNIMSQFTSGNNNAGATMLQPMSAILDAGFQAATPTLASVDLTAPAGSFLLPNTSKFTTAKEIGLECARYWGLTLTPGPPQYYVKVSVKNDAAKIAAPIEANLLALANHGYLSPTYFDFVNAIHKEILTIIWKVTETIPVSKTYNVTVV